MRARLRERFDRLPREIVIAQGPQIDQLRPRPGRSFFLGFSNLMLISLDSASIWSNASQQSRPFWSIYAVANSRIASSNLTRARVV